MPFVFRAAAVFHHPRAKTLVWEALRSLRRTFERFFLLFFAPFVLAYALFQKFHANFGRTRTCGPLSVTAIIVTALTLPFLLPYLELRRLALVPCAQR